MKSQFVSLVLLVALALSLVPSVGAPGPPVYTLSSSPGTLNLRGSVTVTLTIDNGFNNQAYTTVTEVRKPDGTGRATIQRTLTTNNQGFASTTFVYPDSSFTAISGTVETDVAGVYNVITNQTAPTNTGIVATARFTVSSQLTVVVSEPSGTPTVQRGEKITIRASVLDVNNNPVSPASVDTTSPSGAAIFLDGVAPGVYGKDYIVTIGDPTGPWPIRVRASDFRGNYGESSTITVSVNRAELVIEALSTYNSKGLSSTEFSAGDIIYPFFRIRYSSGIPSIQYITTGQFEVGVKNAGGAYVAKLTVIYDSSKFGFVAPTGYSVSAFDPGGSWSIAVAPGSINDGFGNFGPGFETSVRIQIVLSPLTYLPFAIGAIVASLVGFMALRRFNRSTVGLEYVEHLIGGQLPRASAILILGDPGSGKTILSNELLWDELEARRPCALLSYDAFPEDIQARMKEFGWDITSHLRKGRLKIIDCYSSLAGEGEGAIRDPSDLTELNIQITSFISKAKNAPVTVALDSLTPIFNGVEAKQAINFLQTVGAKVKKTGGLFIATASTGAIPADSIAKLKALVDGVLELSLVRSGRNSMRFFTVVKMERRKISPEAIPFEIDTRKGIVFKVSKLNELKRKASSLPVFRTGEEQTQTHPRRGVGPQVRAPDRMAKKLES